MSKLIPVRSWARSVFGEHAPHPNTLLNWIRGGKIQPTPKKIGRAYFCVPDAEYVKPGSERLRRMISGR